MALKELRYPVFYSFRRCPYAMRARLSLIASGQTVELREVLLKEKPLQFLAASPTATVPCLVTDDGIIDESLDIMLWALKKNDPHGWLNMPTEGYDLIERNDGPFKSLLDKTKYHSRYPFEDRKQNRDKASVFINHLESRFRGSYIFGDSWTLADAAIFPFVRQFAFIDKLWFDNQPWPKVSNWLSETLNSAIFLSLQKKFNRWSAGANAIYFP